MNFAQKSLLTLMMVSGASVYAHGQNHSNKPAAAKNPATAVEQKAEDEHVMVNVYGQQYDVSPMLKHYGLKKNQCNLKVISEDRNHHMIELSISKKDAGDTEHKFTAVSDLKVATTTGDKFVVEAYQTLKNGQMNSEIMAVPGGIKHVIKSNGQTSAFTVKDEAAPFTTFAETMNYMKLGHFSMGVTAPAATSPVLARN